MTTKVTQLQPNKNLCYFVVTFCLHCHHTVAFCGAVVERHGATGKKNKSEMLVGGAMAWC